MRRLFGYFSVATVIVVALSIFAAAATAGLVILLGQGFDLLYRGEALDTQWYIGVGGELLALALSTFLVPVVISHDSQLLTSYHRSILLKHYLSIGPLAVRKTGEGELVHAAMESVDRSVKYRSTFLGPASAAAATPVLILIFIALFIDPLSAILLLIPTGLVPVIVLGFQKRFGGSSGEYRRAQGILSATFLDALRSLNMLKLNSGSIWMGKTINAATERVRQQVMKLLARNQLILLVIDSSFAVLLLASSAGLAWWRTSSEALSPGAGFALIILSYLMLAPVNYVGSFFYLGMTGRAAEKQLAEIQEIPMHPSMANPLTVNLKDNGLFIQNVCATYNNADLALNEINLQFPAGSRTAIVGPSGSGKSTLIRVLQGQLESSAGLIHDGRQAMGPATLKANTAVVEQQATLFGVSVGENLRIGAPQATDEQLLAALSQVRLASWLAAQPLGLDQPLGEGGARLSGGQAQRLALARALLAQRPVLLLDEPTSALDVHSEAEIRKILRELGASTTIITVTHRLGLLQDYDYVVVMDHGRVIQFGPREQLVKQEGYLNKALSVLDERTAQLQSSGLRALGEKEA